MGYLFDLYLSQDEKDILEMMEKIEKRGKENGVHSTSLLSNQLSDATKLPNATASTTK